MDEIEEIWNRLTEDENEARRLAREFILYHKGKTDTIQNIADIKKDIAE